MIPFKNKVFCTEFPKKDKIRNWVDFSAFTGNCQAFKPDGFIKISRYITLFYQKNRGDILLFSMKINKTKKLKDYV